MVKGREERPGRLRPAGRQAAMVGREKEMARLQEALEGLLKGRGGIVALAGAMGTGKSRLIKEFKAGLDLATVSWHEGHAYAYTEGVPYYLFIDLLKRIFAIKEADPPELARKKAEQKVMATIAAEPGVIAYVGELLSVPAPELEKVDIDVLRSGLQKAVITFLSALTRQGPTIFCLEDLHWTDGTTLELLRFLWDRLTYPALFLCSYRPPLTLLGDQAGAELREAYQEIVLKDLDQGETQEMVASLLRTTKMPEALKHFVVEKLPGNPFYVEEAVNSLIDGQILFSGDGTWQFSGSGRDMALPATVQGLIGARIERLEARTRELLQEAAVIGRVFCRGILEDVTALKQAPDPDLERLQELEIIQMESTQPDMVYSFRHALFQETVYAGLGEERRRDLHERVGLALEKFFQKRGLAAWETLAFHFQRGHAIDKAVDYLLKSGEKSLKKYALQASEHYYGEAFRLLWARPHRVGTDDLLLVDLVLKWCLVLYYQGRFKEMSRLLLDHLPLAEALQDRGKLGEYYTWLGHAHFWHGASLKEAYQFLHQALELGTESGNNRVVAYAGGFLIKTCAELGLMEEAAAQAEGCRLRLETMAEDYFLNMTYYSGLAYIGWFTGDKNMVWRASRDLLSYGRENQSLRCQMVGHVLLSFWYFMDLDTTGAVSNLEKVVAEGDPYHAIAARLVLGMVLVHRREFEAALEQLIRVIQYSEAHGTEYLKTFANVFLGVALAAQGDLARGLECLEGSNREFREFHRRVFHSMSETILGTIYLQLYLRSGKKSLALLWHNLGVILRNLFSAGRKAEKHFLTAVELAQETGARGFLGQPYLQLGVLYKARGESGKAKEYFLKALNTFRACDMRVYAQRTEEMVRGVEQG